MDFVQPSNVIKENFCLPIFQSESVSFLSRFLYHCKLAHPSYFIQLGLKKNVNQTDHENYNLSLKFY